ncbi:hypothetical protein B0A75_17905 [Flavobacterium oncorhynchi]|uniref:Uncharacterized protein n=1 Tax=Flavobacterium oncorhynchi TaxID=728056 RepID=A0A226HNU6_9FLAO|nr:hypothetical protein B0A75_17905 [Flavobacterium oncorhynchi]
MVRVDVSEIELLPDRFIALLIEEKITSSAQYYFVEQKGENYYYTKDKIAIKISKSVFANTTYCCRKLIN